MATPKRNDLTRKQAKSRKVSEAITSEYSKFLAMKYDKEHNSLPLFKEEEYERLKQKYGTK